MSVEHDHDPVAWWRTHYEHCTKGARVARQALAEHGIFFPDEDQPTEEIPIVTPEMIEEADSEH